MKPEWDEPGGNASSTSRAATSAPYGFTAEPLLEPRMLPVCHASKTLCSPHGYTIRMLARALRMRAYLKRLQTPIGAARKERKKKLKLENTTDKP